MDPHHNKSIHHPYLLLTLATLFWSGNWVVGRAIRHDVPPLALAFWRWTIAALIVLPFARDHLRTQWPLVRSHWKPLAALGVLGTGFYNALAYIGLQYTTATNGVLLNSAVPIVIIALAALFFHERLTLMQYLGVAVSLIGVLAIVSHGHLETLATLTLNVGDLWVLASVVSWAVYTLCMRYRPAGLHPIALLFVLILFGLAPLVPAYAWEHTSVRHMVWSANAVVALCYVSIFPAVLSYLCWNRGVEAVGASRAGLFMHLMPVFGTLLSVLFLGERPQVFQIAGIGLIFVGIFLTTRRKLGAR